MTVSVLLSCLRSELRHTNSDIIYFMKKYKGVGISGTHDLQLL